MALRLKANRRFPSVPVVTTNTDNHTLVLMAMKEALDIGQRRTNDMMNSFVRVEDLVDLGLITIDGNFGAAVGADLSEIADIGDISNAADGDFLRFNGEEWVNDSLRINDITEPMVVQHEAALTIDWTQLANVPPTITAPALDDLTDVVLTTPLGTEFLRYNGTVWVNAPLTEADISASMVTQHQAVLSISWPQITDAPLIPTVLDDLTDVLIIAPELGEVLTWSGSSWVAQPPQTGTPGATDLDGLLDVEVPAPNPGDVLTWNDASQMWISAPPSGVGISDHGLLSGLDDDDHPQYHNDARGDARYSLLAHTHVIPDVTGLQTALDAKASLNLFTDVLDGLTPASGGGTDNYLRADGTWAEPAGTFVLDLAADYPWTGLHTFAGKPVITSASTASANGWSLNLSSATPGVHWYETDAAADNRAWDLIVNDESFIGLARNDAFNLASHWIRVERTGHLIDTVTFPALVNVTGPRLEVTANQGRMDFVATGAPADEHRWIFQARANGGFEITMMNDAATVFNQAILIERTGAIADSIDLRCTSLLWNGVLIGTGGGSIDLAADYPWTGLHSFSNASGRVTFNVGSGGFRTIDIANAGARRAFFGYSTATGNAALGLAFGAAGAETETQAMIIAPNGSITFGDPAIAGAYNVSVKYNTTANGLAVVSTFAGSSATTLLNCTNNSDSDFMVYVSQVGATSKFARIGPSTNTTLYLATTGIDRVGVSPTMMSVVYPSYAPSGVSAHFELRAPNSGVGGREIAMRFHEENQWYKCFRCTPGGFSFTEGASGTLVPIYASNLSYAGHTHDTYEWSAQPDPSNWNTFFTNTNALKRMWAQASVGGPTGTWWFVENYRHSNMTNSWGRQHAWGWEDNANEFYTRNISGGNFGGWVRFLNSSNYNAYAPTLTGGGASGSWPISVTGTAGSTVIWFSQSHPVNYYLVNNWDGARWNISSNHGAAVRVAYADYANDAAQISAGIFYLNGKNTIDAADGYLRLNQTSAYPNGLYTPSVMRADGGFNIGSSRKLKTETGKPTNLRPLCQKLRPVLYRLLADPSHEQLGVIAEEVHALCPWLSKDGESVMYDRFGVLILAVLQEMHFFDEPTTQRAAA